jgi:hypothetical protein
LYELGLCSQIAMKKPFLNYRHKDEMLAFAKEHQYWTIRDWSSIIWSNEALFEIGKHSSQI